MENTAKMKFGVSENRTEAEIRKAKALEKMHTMFGKCLYIDATTISPDSQILAQPHFQELKDVLEDGRQGSIYIAGLDPSYDKKEDKIYFLIGEKPAVNVNWQQANKLAKGFLPELESRLGSRTDYLLCMYKVVEQLTKKGDSVLKATGKVMGYSLELGNYADAKNASFKLEPTGFRPIGEFSDLGNTYKILGESEEEEGFYIASGSFSNLSNQRPVGKVEYMEDKNFILSDAVPFIVIPA